MPYYIGDQKRAPNLENYQNQPAVLDHQDKRIILLEKITTRIPN